METEKLITVAAVYTANTLVSRCTELFREIMPEVKLINIVDEGFISRVIADGEVKSNTAMRLLHYYQAAEEAGADYIFNTCSSVGDIAESASDFIGIPIIRIDAAMALEAVRSYRRIAVLATVQTTLGPTMRLVRKTAADEDKKVEIIDGLAAGAFEALMSGDREKHNRIILETAQRLADKADVFLLAQASMAIIEVELKAQTGKPVLTSVESGMAYLRETIAAGRV